jgi:hypothetical protein
MGKNTQRRWLGSTGYWFIKQDDASIVSEHRVIYEQHHGPIPDGWHVHHIDEDKTNNDPANLEALPWPEHKRRHEGHWQDNDGDWWKRCRICCHAQPEEDFPTKRYVDGVRKTRGNCRACERDRQRAKNGYQGCFEKNLGLHFGPRSAGRIP